MNREEVLKALAAGAKVKVTDHEGVGRFSELQHPGGGLYGTSRAEDWFNGLERDGYVQVVEQPFADVAIYGISERGRTAAKVLGENRK